MRRILAVGTLMIGVLGAGLVATQVPSASAQKGAATPAPSEDMPPRRGMGRGTGAGMMGMCPGLFDPETKVSVTKTASGITISFSAQDPKAIARIQKMGEAWRLMHEASTQ